MYKITEDDLQPREKAEKYGIKKLTDMELISVILGSGSSTTPLKTLSRAILNIIDSNCEITLERLCSIKGIGLAKATTIMSALEFSRRIQHPDVVRISYPRDVLPSVRHYVTREQEYFIVISLNGAHEIIKTRIVSIGILNKTLIHPREVFSDPIRDRAASIILCHNHPSGNLEPSPEDRDVTDRLKKSGDILGINVLDHIIFSSRDYYSFAENNLI